MPDHDTGDRASTLQLRTYQLTADTLEDFLGWWENELLPARRAYGFTVPVAYVVPGTFELVWIVGHPGDEEAFTAAEQAYKTWPDRVAVMARQPVAPVGVATQFIRAVPTVEAP